jgi:chromosome segregation ATPase
MASEVFSVKVSEELKEKIKGFIDESGMQGKDFMEEIIRLYELNAAKDIMPSAMGDVEELQAVTRRINDIFVGLIERSSNLTKDREMALNSEIDKKNRSITLVQEKLDKTLEELEGFRTENENINKKYQEIKEEVSLTDARIQEQEKNHRSLLESKEDLIREYKEKNDALNGVISEYQEYKDKNKELAASIEKMKVDMELLKKQVEEKERGEEKLKVELEHLRSQNEVTVLKVQMEKEKAVLDLREKHQTKYEDLNSEYNAKVDEYNKKVKALLDEIENIRESSSKPEKESKKK